MTSTHPHGKSGHLRRHILLCMLDTALNNTLHLHFVKPSPSCLSPLMSRHHNTVEHHTCCEWKLQTAVLVPQGFPEVPIWFTHKQFWPTYKTAIVVCLEYLTVSGLDKQTGNKKKKSYSFTFFVFMLPFIWIVVYFATLVCK